MTNSNSMDNRILIHHYLPLDMDIYVYDSFENYPYHCNYSCNNYPPTYSHDENEPIENIPMCASFSVKFPKKELHIYRRQDCYLNELLETIALELGRFQPIILFNKEKRAKKYQQFVQQVYEIAMIINTYYNIHLSQ